MLSEKKQMDSKRWKSTAGALIALTIIASSVAGYEYLAVSALQSQKSSLSSVVGSQSTAYSILASSYVEDSNLSVVIQAFDSHLSHIDETNATAVASDYAPNATMIWAGNAWALGGTYTGSSDIKFLWETLLHGTNTTATASALNITRLPNATVILKADLYYRGYSEAVENFNATASSTYSYVFQTGQWQITRESAAFTKSYQEIACPGSPCWP